MFFNQAFSNRMWAQRYVPGSRESGVPLPPDCKRVYLTICPREHRWKACFKHPKLEEMRLRITHSRCYNRLHSLSEYLRVLHIGHEDQIHFLSDDEEDGLRVPAYHKQAISLKEEFYSPQHIKQKQAIISQQMSKNNKVQIQINPLKLLSFWKLLRVQSFIS